MTDIPHNTRLAPWHVANHHKPRRTHGAASRAMIGKQQMAQHITELTTAHDIQVNHLRSSRNAWAIREADGGADEIIIPPVRSEITYVTALHEIGHILGRYQNSPRVAVRERWAWHWAKANALFWSQAMERYRACRYPRCIAMQSEKASPRV